MLAIASTWLEGVCLSKSLLYAYGTEENDVHNQSHTLFQIIISTLGQFAAYWQIIRLDVWRIYNQNDRLSSPREIVYDLMINFVYLRKSTWENRCEWSQNTEFAWSLTRWYIASVLIRMVAKRHPRSWITVRCNLEQIVRVVRMTISNWLTFYKSP